MERGVLWHFPSFWELLEINTNFYAIDGAHEASVVGNEVELGMSPVLNLDNAGDDFFVDTGSPHHVRFVENVLEYPVFEEGAKIRHNDNYAPKGTNVNFVTPLTNGEIQVRTYERGVEDETLSCGTGVTACAIVFGNQHQLNEVKIKTFGGNLKVRFTENPDGSFDNIQLIGPAEQVFEGRIEI
jgi:diaminopimelate epimerase